MKASWGEISLPIFIHPLFFPPVLCFLYSMPSSPIISGSPQTVINALALLFTTILNIPCFSLYFLHFSFQFSFNLPLSFLSQSPFPQLGHLSGWLPVPGWSSTAYF